MISIPEFRNEPYLDFTQPENQPRDGRRRWRRSAVSWGESMTF